MTRSRRVIIKVFVIEMRPYQWAKNVLVALPLLMSHEYADASQLLTVSIAVVAFSLCASGAYFLNDQVDLDSDRRHPTKRSRPLASGALPIIAGVVGAAGLPLVAFILSALTLNWHFLVVMALYYALTNLYTFYLKRVSTADVMTLAVLYTLRVIGGAAAASLAPSFWLLAFSMFFFVSLAYLKRYIEFSDAAGDQISPRPRGYDSNDSETTFNLGVANITASVLVLAFYTSSDEVTRNYATPEALWLLPLLLLYWSNRIWVGARRGKIHDDPIIFVIRDSVSRVIAGLGMLTLMVGRYANF